MTVTLTATYQDGAGTPCSGRVVFRLAEVNTDGTVIYTDHPISEILDANGALSVALTPTDTMSTTSSYEVTERLNGSPVRQYFVQLDSTPATQDLAALRAYTAAPTPTGRPTTHGDLNGLGDDDHTQYAKESTLPLNALNYGAYGTTRRVTDAAITSGAAVLTSATAAFTAADVGSTVVVDGAGTASQPLVTTISTYTNSTTVTLAATASATLSDVQAYIGPDDTTALAALLAAAEGGACRIPAGCYTVSSTLRLPSDIAVEGDGSSDTNGTIILWAGGWNTSVFDSDPTTYLSNCRVQDVQVINGRDADTLAPAAGGTGHGFDLTAVVNNSAFRRVTVRNLSGNGWNIAKISGDPDATASGNVVYEQCFVVSVGGYAFKVDGYATSTWKMCDVNSPATGAFYFLNGVSNQANIIIDTLWYEGTRAWASTAPIKLSNMDSQVVNLIGCNFAGPSSGTNVVTIDTTTGASVNLIGCTGYTYSKWISDTVSSKDVTWSARITYHGTGTTADTVTVQGVNPLLDFYEVDGTADQRRWRLATSGAFLVLTGRNDAQTVRYTPVQWSTSDGVTWQNERLDIKKTWTQAIATQTYSSGLLTINCATANVHKITLGASITSTGFSAPTAGQLVTLIYLQDGTGGWTVLTPTIKWAGGAAPTWVTTANKANIVQVIYDGSSWWEVSRSLGVA